MTSITTKLVKDGNSVAVRIPKTALKMSGLRDEVTMEIQEGQIILKSATSPRSDWPDRIAQVIATNPRALDLDSDLSAWDSTSSDGLDVEY